MKRHELLQLLGLSRGEQEYLERKFDSEEESVPEIDAGAFMKSRQMMAVRVNDTMNQLPLHKHNYIEMMYVFSGSIVHHINGQEVVLNEGDLLLMNQYVEHEAQRKEESLGVVFMIRPEFFDVPMQMISGENEIREFLVNSFRKNSPKPQYLVFRGDGRRNVGNLLENLIDTVRREDDSWTIISQYTVGLIFLYLLGHAGSLVGNYSHGYKETMIHKILEYIDFNYSTITLGQIADDFHQPLSNMSKLIKESTGYTFRELLLRKRFQKAVQLLLETDLRVEEIAIHVGYENTSYFYRQFKKRCSMTPRQYRLIHKQAFRHRNSG